MGLTVPWPALQVQFGWHNDWLNNFKPEFRQTVQLMHSQYRAVRIELNNHGMTLRRGPPLMDGTRPVARADLR